MENKIRPVPDLWPMGFPPHISVDPDGSYTGRPEISTEQPVQDADDL